MNKCGTVTLETDRLILRKIQKSDAKDMLKNYCNDEDVVKFLPWYPHKDIKVTKQYIRNVIKKYHIEKENSYHWVIVLKETTEVIGAIDFGKYDKINSNCELGYCLSKSYWNKGIMPLNTCLKQQILKEFMQYMPLKILVAAGLCKKLA